MSEEMRNLDQEIIEDASSDSINENDAASLSFDDLDELTQGAPSEESNEEAEAEENELSSEAESNGEESEASEETLEEEIKKLIAKYGDQETEIAANALFKHKVDGEEVEVELQELLNNYSGKVSYDKKFQEFSNQKKDFDAYKNQYDNEIQQINGYINDFAKKIKDNDAMGALEYFAQFAGMKPYEFRRELLNQITPEISRRANLSPEQIQAEDLAMQNEYLLQQQESAQKQSQAQQAQKELEMEIANVQEAHGMSDEAFNEAYQDLLDSDYDGTITPQSVADYYVHSQAFSRADSILEGISPVLAEQEQIVESLQKVIVENPSFDNDDLKEIVEEVYGDFLKETSKSVSKKVAPKKKQNVQQSQPVSSDILDWDDL